MQDEPDFEFEGAAQGYTGSVKPDGDGFRWTVFQDDPEHPAAEGTCATKGEAMQRVHLVSWAFGIPQGRQEQLVFDPKDYALEKFEKYNKE